MSLANVMKVAQSGLEMQRARLELIASNLANAQTTRTSEGGPYRRQMPIVGTARAEKNGFAGQLERAVRTVEVQGVQQDPRPPVMRFAPGHPDADAQGYVAYPNVDPTEEMVDMLSAVRSYEANVNVVKTARQMNEAALQMVR